MIDRSAIMRSVPAKDTSPELRLRKSLHGLGYRYRLHRRDLPGKPDIVFPSRRKVIFVHGCFWHGHDCKRGARVPKTNTDYWTGKISRNRERDREHCRKLNELGWSNMIVWECELRESPQLMDRIVQFLDGQ